MKFELEQFISYLKNIKHEKSSQKAIGEAIGVPQAYVSQIAQGKRPFKDEYLELIKQSYGKDIISDYISFIKKNKRKDEAVPILNPNVKMIPLVSQYAQAGYLCGFSDEEYMETLPKVPIIVDHEIKGEYVAFEVKGDSMDNETAESLLEGEILIGRKIHFDYWRYKLHINKWNFIIVHKTDGIIVKRIIEHDVENGTITTHSLNPMYSDNVYSLNDIDQLFNVVQILRSGRI